jgi:hypothetical protein
MKTKTVGTSLLSAWQVAPGVVWIQTRSPQFARKLSQRSDGRLVARGVAGGFLRTFEFKRGMAWAESLIKRYEPGNEKATNADKIALIRPPRPRLIQIG